jgi:hypothetical protein
MVEAYVHCYPGQDPVLVQQKIERDKIVLLKLEAQIYEKYKWIESFGCKVRFSLPYQGRSWWYLGVTLPDPEKTKTDWLRIEIARSGDPDSKWLCNKERVAVTFIDDRIILMKVLTPSPLLRKLSQRLRKISSIAEAVEHRQSEPD